MLKYEPFMSNRRFKKGTFFEKNKFLLSYFCTLFCQKRTFCYPTTFFESLMNHKLWGASSLSEKLYGLTKQIILACDLALN